MRLASILILTMALSMLVMPSVQQNSIMVDPTGPIQFGGLAYKKPGLKVRVTQALSDLVKSKLLQY